MQKVKEIIEFYKEHFYAISNEEIYKWRAVKCFQDNWDINASNFVEMLKKSLALTENLLVSVNYFPRRMILQYAEKEPEVVRNLFAELFNEENGWIERIKLFQHSIISTNEKHFPGKLSYQDARAVLVYLTLRFPDIYFLYKFTIFKKFAEQIEYPHKPVKGRIDNLSVYSNICELVREEIIEDKVLTELHEKRLNKQHYFDKSFNILTQDVIYAAVTHFKKFEQSIDQQSTLERLIRIDKPINVSQTSSQIILKGSSANYIESEKRKKIIGDFGELLVLKYEQEKLKKLRLNKQPEHVSVTRGDGLGYDILSFDEAGKEIYIEVKTTTKNYNSEFFVTRHELEKSIRDSGRYYLYRLYEYNKKEDTAKFRVQQGSLKNLCINPDRYRVEVIDEL